MTFATNAFITLTQDLQSVLSEGHIAIKQQFEGHTSHVL